MKSTTAVASLLALACRAVSGQQQGSANTTSCPQMHVIAARETTAPPGFGSAQALVGLIMRSFPGTTAESINYPAASGTNYSSSVTAGVLAVLAQTAQFAAQCPDTILVLHGYSQGAQIMDDAFCGGPDGGSLLSTTPPLVQSTAGQGVAAILLFGNPRHAPGLAYNVGNATAGGFAARPARFSCPLYEDRMQSYCDTPDPYCTNGTDAAFHQGYGQRNGQQALQFLVSKLMIDD